MPAYQSDFTLSDWRARQRDGNRRRDALRYGYLPPPKEKDCPPKPEDGLCQCCGERPKRSLHLDHCHDIGAFRRWVCNGCNTGAGIMDNPERLEKRAAFLRAHKKKMERIALIKQVHTSVGY